MVVPEVDPNTDKKELEYKTLLAGTLLVFVAALVLYVLTCAPGPLWQDSGMFQYRVWNNDIRGGLGLALAHPLYHWIGAAVKAIPLGEFGLRVNLISAVSGAVAVANVFLWIALWTRKAFPALIAATTLAVSWTFWQHAVIAEVYTLYAAVFSAELVCLYLYFNKRAIGYVYGVAFLNGLSIANHMWGVIPLFCYLVFLGCSLKHKTFSVRQMVLLVAVWIAGVLPYAWLVVEHLLQSGSLAKTLSSAFFGDAWSSQVLNVAMSRRVIIENLIFIAYNFASPNIFFILSGVFVLFKCKRDKSYTFLILFIGLLFLIFAFRYTVVDRYAFFIPFYVLAAGMAGVGVHALISKFRMKIIYVVTLLFAFAPVCVYAAAPGIAESQGVSLGVRREIPYRNSYEYFLTPWQCGNHGPESFASDVLNSLANQAVVYADGTTVYALWYMQEVQGLGHGMKIIAKHGDYHSPVLLENDDVYAGLVEAHPFYVVSPIRGYCPQYLLDNYTFEQVGSVYRVINK